MIPQLDKIYEIDYYSTSPDPEDQGKDYKGLARCISGIADQDDNDNDLYLFLLPSGNQCYFTDEDIIKESDSLVLTSL